MGWSSNTLNELSEMFVAACQPGMTVLDIGAAMGVATIPALERGVIAHVIEPSAEHVAAFSGHERLHLHHGRFPRDLKLPADSIDLAHASNVFHFLTGRQLELGAALLHRVLKPGGKVFVIAATPYMAPFAGAVDEYERRRAERWPGWIENTRAVSTHRLLDQLPKSIHLLDDAVLSRVFAEAGFSIDRCWMLRRRDLPKSLFYDGRENVALVASKTLAAQR